MPTPMRNAWRRPRNIPFAKLAGAYTPDLLEAPLRGSIVPLRGATVTFTRASTATVLDHEGITRYCKSGEARFQGLRRVENLVRGASEDASSIAYVANNTATKANDAGGGGVINLAFPAPGDSVYFMSGAQKVGSKYQNAVDIRVASGSGGTVTLQDPFAGQWADKQVTLTTTWQRVNSGLYTSTNAYQGMTIKRVGAGDLSAVQIRYPQIEDVTDQSVQTPAEYVSLGVLSWPYHGAGADGVKYFANKLDGSVISGGGYLYEPSRTQLLANPDDLSAAPWSGSIFCTTDTTSFRGRRFQKLTKTLSSGSEDRFQQFGTGVSGYFSTKVAALASANSASLDIVFYGSSTGFGSAGDGVLVIESGPGSAALISGGGWWRLTGLSTTVPTVVMISRNFASADSPTLRLYPDTSPSTTIGRTVYVQVDNIEAGRTSTSFIPNAATSGTVTRAADALNYSLASLPANNLTFAATITKLVIPPTSNPPDSPISIGGYTANGYVSLGGYNGTQDTVIGSWPNVWDIAANIAGIFPAGQSVRAAWSFDPDGKTWRSSFGGGAASVRTASTVKTVPWSNTIIGLGCIGGVNGMTSAVNVISNLRVYSTAYPPEVITQL